MAVPWPVIITTTFKAGEKVVHYLLNRPSPQKEALIVALITSIPIITKELLPEIKAAIKNLLKRKHSAYYANHADVCHAYEDCTTGSKVNPEHRQAGTGDKELCVECRDRMLGT